MAEWIEPGTRVRLILHTDAYAADKGPPLGAIGTVAEDDDVPWVVWDNWTDGSDDAQANEFPCLLKELELIP